MKKRMEHAPFISLSGERSGIPLYRQIYRVIRASILSGEFAPKTRLPSTRDLAQSLGVSRITVTNAYEQLFAEGYLEGRRGAGTFVAAELPENLLQTNAGEKSEDAKNAADLPLRLSPYGEKLLSKTAATPRNSAQPHFRPFQNGLTAVDEFPFEIWARIAAKYYKNPPRFLLGYGDPQGYAPLREAIAAHLRAARGVKCAARQVVITSGAQQALDLTARIFISGGDAVLIENPCYAEAKNLFTAAGARIIPVDVDGEGFNSAWIPEKGKSAKLVYTTPSHQYPLGATMTLARRLALLDWARSSGAWIIEDDYNSEYRYSGRPLASMQGLDASGRVIYVGTFSKTIFPSLRIGCAVVPEELVEIFTAARALTDVHSALTEQAVLAEFIAEGHFARHLRRMRKLYEKRQRILVEECEKHLKGLLEIESSDAGMHLVGWLSPGIDDREISRKAAEKGLKISPLSDYRAESAPRRGALILGYTAFDENQIKGGVKRLKECLEK